MQYHANESLEGSLMEFLGKFLKDKLEKSLKETLLYFLNELIQKDFLRFSKNILKIFERFPGRISKAIRNQCNIL